ncbi:hypothetical protein M2109_005001 [Paenibacillus sp. PastH-3]|nr:hypothetical protein [Paenibacillus sp. PastH-4]MDH6445884.1 hypothetical protein [Paenibacillus sp. PastF-4]MDH6530645.1 hypothetical protein [Paenibacillus sp. PastH-3]
MSEHRVNVRLLAFSVQYSTLALYADRFVIRIPHIIIQ